MKRWLTHLVITAYLGALCFGILAHTVSYKNGAHPVMYFLVWDMFCGWASHESRLQVVGEGESGKYYELAPGPWGEIQPYGNIGRRHYDTFCMFTPKMAFNSLKNTRHEPIKRIYVVEECWAKKYNLPDDIWARRHTEEKVPHHYFHLRLALDGDGHVLQQNDYWLNYQSALCVSNNPRLMADARKGRPFYNVSLPQSRPPDSGLGDRYEGIAPSASRLGN
jgi:hypothetical protein